MSETVTHITQNGKYKIVIERIGSAKGTLGYKVEANGDNYTDVVNDIEHLKQAAENIAGLPVVETKKE